MIERGRFFFRSSPLESINARQFGYWSVAWAHDNALGQLELLLNNEKFNTFPIVNSIRETQFHAYLQFLALYAASYWAYAVLILAVEASSIQEMGIGLEDALENLGDPSGKPYDNDLKKLFKQSFGAYYKSITIDFREVREPDYDPAVINPDINNVSKSGVHMFAQCYPGLRKTGANEEDDAMVEVDRTVLGHLIADVPPRLFMLLKEEIGLEYQLNDA